LGASEAGLSRCRVALREGATAEVRGPRPTVAELKALPLTDIRVMGCKAALTPDPQQSGHPLYDPLLAAPLRHSRSPSGVPEEGGRARVPQDDGPQSRTLWRPQSFPDLHLQRSEHAVPRHKYSSATMSTMARSASTGKFAKSEWEQIAMKLFSRLEQHGGGFVAAAQVLVLWPQLSTHVEFGHAEALVAHLQGSSSRMPISTGEWMSLLEALSSIVGPRRLRRNIRSADMQFGEIRGGVLSQEPLPWKYSSKSTPGTATADTRVWTS